MEPVSKYVGLIFTIIFNYFPYILVMNMNNSYCSIYYMMDRIHHCTLVCDVIANGTSKMADLFS